MTIHIITGARLDCAAALFQLDGYRIWSTPDDPSRCAITRGGTELEAHIAVVETLRETFAGDWTREAILMTKATTVQPCRWCATRQQYGH